VLLLGEVGLEPQVQDAATQEGDLSRDVEGTRVVGVYPPLDRLALRLLGRLLGERNPYGLWAFAPRRSP
jgi:hypothetical protein